MKKIYSILYTADDEIFKVGPFDSEEAACEWMKSKEGKAQFDIETQHVYILTPDHRMIEVWSADLEKK
jgi:heme-degrading monooxygenase HmoA